MTIDKNINEACDFYEQGHTKSIGFRYKALSRLEELVLKNEEKICRALFDDLRKSRQESIVSEYAFVLEEIRLAKRKIKKWAKPKSVSPTFLLLPSKSKIHFEPKGVVLILGPWNYPFQLLLSPLVAAITAGNCAVIKPSELAPHTSKLLVEIFKGVFPENYIRVVEGGVQETTELLALKWDHIFFTGSTAIGKIILKAASEHLTPVTLELGGKSPCLVCEDANIDLAAKRIVWGKFYNAGQTCVAPDFLYVHKAVKQRLVNQIKVEIKKQFGVDPSLSDALSRIINNKNFKRVSNLIDSTKVIFGGKTDEDARYIEPTLMDKVSWDDSVMKEEVFGPILPILSFDNFEDTLALLRTKPKPLSAYIFTTSKAKQDSFVKDYSFGGGTINDVILHLANPGLPFGGVGESGMGAYHGRFGFLTFSHQKSVLKRYSFFDFSARYAPYDSSKLKFLRKLMNI